MLKFTKKELFDYEYDQRENKAKAGRSDKLPFKKVSIAINKISGLKAKSGPKYKNKKTVVNGIPFDSKKESARYLELKMLQTLGDIRDLQLQVSFEVVPSVRLNNGKKQQAVNYIADFVYRFDGLTVVEDVKSEITRKLPVYILKKKLMKHVHNIEISEV